MRQNDIVKITVHRVIAYDNVAYKAKAKLPTHMDSMSCIYIQRQGHQYIKSLL